MDEFLPTTLAFLGAIVLAVHVGKHSVRHNLRKWCNTQIADLEGDGRYAEGYRQAIEDVQAGLKRRKIEFAVRTEGEI